MKKLVTICAAAALMLAMLALPSAALARGAKRDRNHDRIPDRWERVHHLNLRVNQALRDQDRDGLGNLAEYRSHTDPRDADSDNDGVGDADEDNDRDHVDNDNEALEHTSPTDADTDDDGVRDGAEDPDRDAMSNRTEDVTAHDPLDPDSDDDGIEDGDEDAGRILSFTDGTLTIVLAGGKQVSGEVTADTQVSCGSEDDQGDDEAMVGAANAEPRVDPGLDDGEDFAFDDAGDSEDAGAASDAPRPPRDGPRPPREGDGPRAAACSQDDLVAGRGVHEARLSTSAHGLVFREIALLR